MGFTEFLLIFLVLAFCAPVALVVCQAAGALIDEARGTTPCAPSRRANITASVPQERRRVLSERTLGPPAGWHEPQHVAIVPAPAVEEVDELDDIEDWDDDELEPESLPAVALPELAPIAVPEWPTRQTVEPEPVVVNWTAARFGSLEIKRD